MGKIIDNNKYGMIEIIKNLDFFITSVVNTNPKAPLIPQKVLFDLKTFGINKAWIMLRPNFFPVVTSV